MGKAQFEMATKRIWRWLAGGVLAIANAALLYAALHWRMPVAPASRWWLHANLIGAAAVVLLLAAIAIKLGNRRGGLAAAAVAVLSIGVMLAQELGHRRERGAIEQVASADPARLALIGRHIIVGYSDLGWLRQLAGRGMIAGIFVTKRNALGKSAAELGAEIAGLQSLRREKGLAPLIVATDQEGGIVSRLSPPLERPRSLAEVVATAPDATGREVAVRAYAAKAGRDLASVGVTLNFAPVVDLDHNVAAPADRYTRIGERAISGDPAIVRDVAGWYCDALLAAGVACTLKHFPGLGRVTTDTHIDHARLDAPLAELQRTDWLPFRALMADPRHATMLAHARLVALDGKSPASASHQVVNRLLRQEWQHDGVLVTDDLTMYALYASSAGIGGSAVAALNAGVDLLLVSYDEEQVYPMLHELLRAEAGGRLERSALERSARRLEVWRQKIAR
jgi:beta-N-acetylhexosaminidase